MSTPEVQTKRKVLKVKNSNQPTPKSPSPPPQQPPSPPPTLTPVQPTQAQAAQPTVGNAPPSPSPPPAQTVQAQTVQPTLGTTYPSPPPPPPPPTTPPPTTPTAAAPTVQPSLAKPTVAKAPAPKPKLQRTVKPKGKVHYQRYDKTKFTQVRYRTRILKGSFLPILFGLFSFSMLREATLEYPGAYKIETLYIIFGFLLGFGVMSGITIANVLSAKSNPVNGSKLHSHIGYVIFIPFIVIVIVFAFIEGIAIAWQFSIGFFLAAIFPALFVTIFELSSKKKFFVQEPIKSPAKGRKLIAVSASALA